MSHAAPARPSTSQDFKATTLQDFKATKGFFVGVDSDGCVFNSMEVKHNDCFSVALVRTFELGEISRQTHEVWDFVNLYSQTRGCNRFKAITLAFDRLRPRALAAQASVEVPKLAHLKAWLADESKPSNSSLATAIAHANGERKQELSQILQWSSLVNDLVALTVKQIPPFSAAKRCLERFTELADTVVISSTPLDVLRREWADHQLDQYVDLIVGQEMGQKSEVLRLTTEMRYPKDRILMIGDAPGDLSAARSIGALFFPIVPGREQASWEQLFGEASHRFFGETYRGAYEDALIEDFASRLPDEPTWDGD